MHNPITMREVADAAQQDIKQSASLHASITFPDWVEALERSYGLRCERHRGHTSETGIEARELGEIRIADVRMSAQTLMPRRRMESTEDQLYLKLVLDGLVMFEQNGERQCFNTGSLLLVDPSRSFEERVEQATRLIVVTCPKEALRARGYSCQFDHRVALDARSPDVRMVYDMVRLIASHHFALQDHTRVLLGGQLLDLMDVLVKAEQTSGGRTAAAIRHRVKRYIAQHLGDDGLDATMIANGVGLSVSYLSRLFREEGTTLMRFLWCQRLQHAHRLLEAPKLERLRIDEIAWRCGFASAAHFSRSFKQRYGFSPRAMREREATPG